MCLYPKQIRNKKYIPNKKNRGKVPEVKDPRALFVSVGCGECMECRKKKANAWCTRLCEDIKYNKECKFITLTFSNEKFAELYNESNRTGYEKDNHICKIAVRRFLERWRKKYKKSVRHWLITELGGGHSEHVHMHGVIWCNAEQIEELEKIWQYGFVWTGKEENGEKINYVNEQTVNYIIKYFNKTDILHPNFKPKIFASAGIGKEYVHSEEARRHVNLDNDYYRNRSGYKGVLPVYYRQKLYTDEQREKMWMEKLDKEEVYICGEVVDIKKNKKNYFKLLKWYRRINRQLGYGNGNKDIDNYEKELKEREEKHNLRLKKIKENVGPARLAGFL